MKRLFSVLFLLWILPAYSQKINPLDKVRKQDSLWPGESAVYGRFVQRLGFSSGGLPQYVHIRNKITDSIYSLIVKPAYKSARQNTFCAYLPPGDYEILAYHWAKSEWYGSKHHAEQVYKGYVYADILPLLRGGEMKEEQLSRFTFHVPPEKLVYVGTWHFEEEPVSFTDDKQATDERLSEQYRQLDFSSALISIPE